MIFCTEGIEDAGHLLDIGAIEFEYNGFFAFACGHVGFHRIGNAVHVRAAAEYADQNHFDGRIAIEQRKRRFVAARGGRAGAGVKKARRLAAQLVDGVHCPHGQPGTAGNETDIAIKLDVHMPHFKTGAQQFIGTAPFAVALREDVGVAVMRPIVVNDFCIECHQFAIVQPYQRIDLDGVAVARGGGFHQALRQRDHALAQLKIFFHGFEHGA